MGDGPYSNWRHRTRNRTARPGGHESGGRLIPIHPELGDALSDLRRQTEATGPVLRSQRGGPMTPVSIVNWFANAYRAIGLQGCSSHSGRRTFITRAARLVHHAGAWLPRCTAHGGPPVRSRPPSGTLTATLTPSASWYR